MRNLAFFMLGLLVSMALGIASAHAAYCTSVDTYGVVSVASTQSTPADLAACANPVLLSASEYATFAQVQQNISPLNPQIAIEDSLAFFGLAFVFLAGIWALRRVYDQFTQPTGEP